MPAEVARRDPGSALPQQLVDPDLLTVACAASSCQDDLIRLG
jgi:hypothetical protein